MAHRHVGDEQLAGDLFVPESLEHDRNELSLPSREGGNPGSLGIAFKCSVRVRQLLEKARREGPVEPYLAAVDFFDCLYQHLHGLLLENHAPDAGAHCLPVHLRVAYSREHENLCSPGGIDKIGEKRQPAFAAHVQIQQDNVRLFACRRLHRFGAGPRLRNHLHGGLAVDQHTQTRADDSMVVHDQHTNRTW